MLSGFKGFEDYRKRKKESKRKEKEREEKVKEEGGKRAGGLEFESKMKKGVKLILKV